MPENVNTLRSQPEGEPPVLRGVVANFAQHPRVHHAAAQHLYPAGIFTGAAALTGADGTIYVHLSAWLREWEVAATKAHAPTLAEKLARNSLQAALEIAHCTVLVDQ